MIDLYFNFVEMALMMVCIPIELSKQKPGIKQSDLDEFREQWIALNESYRNNPNVVFVDNGGFE